MTGLRYLQNAALELHRLNICLIEFPLNLRHILMALVEFCYLLFPSLVRLLVIFHVCHFEYLIAIVLVLETDECCTHKMRDLMVESMVGSHL